jgi:hypothetical protein
MTTLGIDAGLNGAMALYSKVGFLLVEDIPTFTVRMGKGLRQRVDPTMLLERIEILGAIADRAVIEQVAARPQNSGMFAFGQVYGMIYLALITCKIPIHQVTPQAWKRTLQVPGKVTGTNEAIVARADELMPMSRDKWRGPKGGLLVDRAEAAMLAYYGEMYHG